jgi:hypothetical protein
MIGGMGQRRPPPGPSPFTMGRPNPMAQGGGANYAPMAPPPQGPRGPSQAMPLGQVRGSGMGGFQPMAPPPMGGPQGPQQAMPLGQLRGPGMGGGAQQRFGGGYQGAPPWMGTGQPVNPPPPGWSPEPTFNMDQSAELRRRIDAAMPAGGGMRNEMWTPQMQAISDQYQSELGGGAQGMSDAMMHPFAPRNRGPQGIGPQMQYSLAAMQGGMGGGASPVGPQYQRRFPGALGRGILQGMAQPPPQATPPAPYGGQQFRMW